MIPSPPNTVSPQTKKITSPTKESEQSTVKKSPVRLFLRQSAIVGLFVFGAMFVLDLLIDFEGSDRWMLWLIIPAGWMGGTIMTGLLTALFFYDDTST
jgi:hypothetical protein